MEIFRKPKTWYRLEYKMEGDMNYSGYAKYLTKEQAAGLLKREGIAVNTKIIKLEME